MRIVMTGATSGFGLDAAARLVDAGVDDLTIGARTPQDLPESLRHEAVSAHWLDLEDFESVRTFADAIGPDPIDVLVLNAGIQLAKPGRAPNGMEKTFVVNQLSHFLLLQLLEDRLAADARVIFTGSGTHDPAENIPVTPPVHADAERLAWPERDGSLTGSPRSQAMRAYSSSKLANIMTARELARRNPALTVLAYDPGFVPGTDLAREYPFVVQKLIATLAPLAMRGDRISTVSNSGRLLALLMVDRAHDGEPGAYWSVRGNRVVLAEPSALARNADDARAMWESCAALVGTTE